jgi:hypothetical protein
LERLLRSGARFAAKAVVDADADAAGGVTASEAHRARSRLRTVVTRRPAAGKSLRTSPIAQR